MTTSLLPDSLKNALSTLKATNGVFRTRDAENLGLRRETISDLLQAGRIERISKGLYRLANKEPLSNPDLVVVFSRIPDGVLCLLSALGFHKITTQNPQAISIARKRPHKSISLDWPPTHVFLFGGNAFTEGIETHSIDGVSIRVYCKEKTIADCFKYRNRIGLDVALEALRFYRNSKEFDAGKLIRYAEICRVKRIMLPYLEALL